MVLASNETIPAGSLDTLEGHRLTGEITLSAGAVLVSTSTNPATVVPWTNLLSVDFTTALGEASGITGSGNGALGIYSAGTNLDGAHFVRLDQTLDFNWALGDAAPGIPHERFSVVWCGELEPPVTGEYQFSLAADDSASLQLDGKDVLQVSSAREETSPTLRLEGGHRHPLKLTLVNEAGPAQIRLLWSGPGFSKRPVPRDRLHAISLLPAHAAEAIEGRGLLGTYFSNASFAGSTRTRVDPSINFAWTDRDPMPGFGRTNFSVRWTGQIRAEHSEEYTFHVTADERLRLWVDEKPVIHRTDQFWLSESKGTLPLLAGESYSIRLEVASTAGDAVVKLFWSSASTTKTNVPNSHLSPASPQPDSAGSPGVEGRTPPGLLLRNGSFIACNMERANSSSVQASGRLKAMPISTPKVARIVFQSIPKAMESRMPVGRPGLLLAKGDFIDGEFRGFDGQRVRLDSILLGTRTYDARKEVLAVLLRDASTNATSFELRLRDRSVFKADTVSVEGDRLMMRDADAGVMKFQASEIARVKRTGSGN